VTDAANAPALLGGTDHAVGTPPADALTPCASCPHLADGHDPTSLRWCAATIGGNRDRRCICPPGAVVAPGEGDPPGRTTGTDRLLNRLR
jgi:hypothetical protein